MRVLGQSSKNDIDLLCSHIFIFPWGQLYVPINLHTKIFKTVSVILSSTMYRFTIFYIAITKIKVKVSLVLRVMKIFEAQAKTDTVFRNDNNKSVDVLFVSYNRQKEETRYFEQKRGMVLYILKG